MYTIYIYYNKHNILYKRYYTLSKKCIPYKIRLTYPNKYNTQQKTNYHILISQYNTQTTV